MNSEKQELFEEYEIAANSIDKTFEGLDFEQTMELIEETENISDSPEVVYSKAMQYRELHGHMPIKSEDEN